MYGYAKELISPNIGLKTTLNNVKKNNIYKLIN